MTIHREEQKAKNGHVTPEKEDWLRKEEIVLADFKTHYKTIVINTVWYQHRDRQIDQQNRIRESRNISVCMHKLKLYKIESKHLENF